MANKLLRPNGELGSAPCFKCNRIGLPTAARAFTEDPKRAMCQYHEDVARFGKPSVDARILDGTMNHPVEFAREHSHANKAKV